MTIGSSRPRVRASAGVCVPAPRRDRSMDRARRVDKFGLTDRASLPHFHPLRLAPSAPPPPCPSLVREIQRRQRRPARHALTSSTCPTKMLIDASHPEETRVVVTRGHRVEEFDFESADKKQLRGNIYLAKVTRVEPSLQAAFVDYGGNRHAFSPFPRSSGLLPDSGFRSAGASRRRCSCHLEEEENHRPRRSRRHQTCRKRRGDDERLADTAPAALEENASAPGDFAEAHVAGFEPAASHEGHTEITARTKPQT